MGRSVKKNIGFIKRMDNGWITTMSDLIWLDLSASLTKAILHNLKEGKIWPIFLAKVKFFYQSLET